MCRIITWINSPLNEKMEFEMLCESLCIILYAIVHRAVHAIIVYFIAYLRLLVIKYNRRLHNVIILCTYIVTDTRRTIILHIFIVASTENRHFRFQTGVRHPACAAILYVIVKSTGEGGGSHVVRNRFWPVIPDLGHFVFVCCAFTIKMLGNNNNIIFCVWKFACGYFKSGKRLSFMKIILLLLLLLLYCCNYYYY